MRASIREAGGMLGHASLAVVGMAKNTGKTTTVNHLLRACRDFDLTPGITSIGRDGERFDILYGTPKPFVSLPPGALVATAKDTLSRSPASLEVLESTVFRTPLGVVVIARANEGGPVEVAGPQQVTQLWAVVRRMEELGAGPVFIDGAFDRLAGMVPAEGVILATGAALDQNMATVVQITRARVEQLTLPQPEAGFFVRKRSMPPYGGVWRLTESDCFEYLGPSALGSGIRLPALEEDTKAIVATGAVGDRFLAEFIRVRMRRPRLSLLIRHAACLFAGPETWLRVKDEGLKVFALEPVKLLAITVNPLSPLGFGFDARRFRAEMAAAVYPLPVYDWGP